ncbi:hypothetical protein OIU77_005375, partial [Salix suchowensis]
MQADQTTVINLRPGGGNAGGHRGTRFSSSRFESASASFLPMLLNLSLLS